MPNAANGGGGLYCGDGFRAAVDTRLASDGDTQVIVAVKVSAADSDIAQLAPMVDQVSQHHCKMTEPWLVDGGFPWHAQIDATARAARHQPDLISRECRSNAARPLKAHPRECGGP